MIQLLPPTTNSIDPWRLPSIPLSDRFLLPSSPGIYFAIKGDRILYVGMSENICKRWKNHHEHGNLKRVGGVRLHYLELPGWERDRILALEAELIAKYTPRFNDVGVGVRKKGSDRRQGQGGWWVVVLAMLLTLSAGYHLSPEFRVAVDDITEQLE